MDIKGAASGPYIVIAQNFAPGTSAADIESAMLSVGGQMTSCKLVVSNPTVIAEMAFVEKSGAEKVIDVFNGKKADGQPVHVYWKSEGSGLNRANSPGRRQQSHPEPQTSFGADSQILQKIRETSIRIFEALNHGKIEDPIFQVLTPDYHMSCENSQGPYTSSETREDFLHHYQEMLGMNPDYYLNITECSVKLSDYNRRAAVVLSGDASVGAQPTTMRIEVVNLLSWEWRKQEGWVCCRGKCIRSPAGDGMRDA